jgi:hypothetical protein
LGKASSCLTATAAHVMRGWGGTAWTPLAQCRTSSFSGGSTHLVGHLCRGSGSAIFCFGNKILGIISICLLFCLDTLDVMRYGLQRFLIAWFSQTVDSHYDFVARDWFAYLARSSLHGFLSLCDHLFGVCGSETSYGPLLTDSVHVIPLVYMGLYVGLLTSPWLAGSGFPVTVTAWFDAYLGSPGVCCTLYSPVTVTVCVRCLARVPRCMLYFPVIVTVCVRWLARVPRCMLYFHQ